MMREIKADQVKELPVGSSVYLYKVGRDKRIVYRLTESESCKMLMNVRTGVQIPIRDRQTFRYEVEDKKPVPRAATQTGTE